MSLLWFRSKWNISKCLKNELSLTKIQRKTSTSYVFLCITLNTAGVTAEEQKTTKQFLIPS